LATRVVLGAVLIFAAAPCIAGLLWWLRPPEDDGPKPPGAVPAWVTPAVERVFFAVVVGADVSGAATAMMTWLAVKMLTHWNRPGDNLPYVQAFSALLGGLISMFFAMLAGLLWRARLPFA
jgi:hypothetical protein